MNKPHKIRWKRSMIAEGRRIYAAYRRGQSGGWRLFRSEMVQGAWISGHTLTVLIKGGRLLWLLDYGRAGVGFFRRTPAHEWQAEGAAVMSDHRGRGLYPGVLKVLRQWGEVPIVSGRQMSAPAVKAWRKITKQDAAGLYRLNPRK